MQRTRSQSNHNNHHNHHAEHLRLMVVDDNAEFTAGLCRFIKDYNGMGLSLGRELVDMHGGHIWAESQGKSHGSTFTFVLPFKPARVSRENHGR